MTAVLLPQAWAALGGAPGDAGGLEVRGEPGALAAPLAVEELLVAAAGAALLAAAELAGARGEPRPAASLDRDALAVAAASERHARLDGDPVGVAFDPLSAFLRARDGWVRLHGNYAWHREAAMRALDVADPRDVPAAVEGASALDVETAVVAAGGCAAMVRTADAWARSAPGRAAAVGGLVRRSPGPDAGIPLSPLPRLPGHRATPALPAAGLRVVDLTRVIAGPVGTRTLAALGADVVRVERPDRPELPLLALDGGLGKRWAQIDLRTPAGRAILDGALAEADAIVTGHRPGALDVFGLDAGTLAERHPHLVVVSLSAWGDTGPWAGRRGFDSLVQAASGIAEAVSPGTAQTAPGALPVQALDHATGYLVAAAVLRGWTARAREGTAPRARLALAATAATLLAAGARPSTPARDVDATPHVVAFADARGAVRVAGPPGALGGRPLTWPETRDAVPSGWFGSARPAGDPAPAG